MPARLISVRQSAQSCIFLSNVNHQLAQEVVSQLQLHSHLLTVQETDSKKVPEHVSVIIEFVGFTPFSSSQLTRYLAKTENLLWRAVQSNSLYLLVVSKSNPHIYRSIVDFITDFSSTHRLRFQKIEVSPLANFNAEAAKIIQIFVPHHHPPTTAVTPNPSLSRSTTPSTSPLHRRRFRPLLLLLILILGPWMIYLTFSLTALVAINCSFSSLNSGQFSRLRTCAQITSLVSPLITTSSTLAFGHGQVAQAPYFSSLIPVSLLPPLSQSLSLISQTANIYSQTARNISQGSPVNLSPDLARLHDQLKTSLSELFSQLSAASIISNSLTLKLKDLSAALKFLHPLPPILPDLLALNGQKTYAILIQDSNVARPSGGLIEAVILFSLDRGVLKDIQIMPTSSGTRQLQGEVNSPLKFSLPTGKNTWSLKDANWDPDFLAASADISWFLSKEYAFTPDYIISINIESLDYLFSRHISPDYLALNSNSELSSDAFLISQLETLVAQIKNYSPTELNQVLIKFFKLLINRQVFISSVNSDSDLLPVAWSGGLAPAECFSPNPCVINYIYPLISDLGPDKSNAYLLPSYSLSINVTPETITTHLISTLTNTTSSVSPSGGDHHNYFRLYLSPDVKISAVKLNGLTLPESAFTQTSTNKHVELGFLLAAPPSSTSTFEVLYSQHPPDLTPIALQLQFPNQPGQVKAQLAATFTYPRSWRLSTSASPQFASPGLIRYNDRIDHPLQYQLEMGEP